MLEMDIKSPKMIAPVEVVQKSNALIKGVAQMSEKSHKCWPEIDQPRPVEGTFSPDVI